MDNQIGPVFNLNDPEEVKRISKAVFGDAKSKAMTPYHLDIYNFKAYNEVRRNLYLKSFYHCFKWMFSILEPQTEYVDNFHVKFLCDELQAEVERILRGEKKGKDILVNIPPRTTKSMILSVCFPVWTWLRISNARFITSSHSDGLVLQNARLSKDLINHEDFQALFGDLLKIREDKKANEHYGNTRGGERLSATINSSVIGFSALFIIIDDPQNSKSAMSGPDRQSVIDNFTLQYYNRLTPADLGVRILLQQRLQIEDLSGYLLATQPEKWKHINLPAEDDGSVLPAHLSEKYVDGLLDAKRLNRNVLDDMRLTLGSLGFATQYQQKPFTTDSGYIKKDWFEVAESIDYSKETIHFFIDPAYTDKTKNDPTGLLACFMRDNILYVVNCEAVHKSFPDLIKYILIYTKKYGYSDKSVIYIEPKASGISLVQELKSKTQLNVKEDDQPERDKVSRIVAIAPKIEAGRVKLLNGMWITPFIEQVCSISEKQLPVHDDMADTLCQAVNKLVGRPTRRWKFI